MKSLKLTDEQIETILLALKTGQIERDDGLAVEALEEYLQSILAEQNDT